MHSESTRSPREADKPLVLTEAQEQLVRAVLDALGRIRHGSIQLVVQDSQVIQIDTVEKRRLAGNIRAR